MWRKGRKIERNRGWSEFKGIKKSHLINIAVDLSDTTTDYIALAYWMIQTPLSPSSLSSVTLENLKLKPICSCIGYKLQNATVLFGGFIRHRNGTMFIRFGFCQDTILQVQ